MTTVVRLSERSGFGRWPTTSLQDREIWRGFWAGRKTNSILAAEYGLSPAQVERIVCRVDYELDIVFARAHLARIIDLPGDRALRGRWHGARIGLGGDRPGSRRKW